MGRTTRTQLFLLMALLGAGKTFGQPTTNTLRLSDLFDTRPGEGEFHTGAARFNPNGALIFVPDTGAWRAPRPTPTPQPTPTLELPEGVNLPTLRPLALSMKYDEISASREAFEFAGRMTGNADSRDGAMLFIATPTSRLRAEYLLVPILEPGEPPRDALRFLHGPGTEEQFLVPAGRYKLQRRLWLEGSQEKTLTETYSEQLLLPRANYDFKPISGDEGQIIQQYFR
jgi:hypothetical protein